VPVVGVPRVVAVAEPVPGGVVLVGSSDVTWVVGVLLYCMVIYLFGSSCFIGGARAGEDD